ncbi:MAG: 4'-phosphopantetheinyl transferase superfamily protein [Dehalococcoidia bacterium]|nr:4'-phosphopantetheinyl transferase superfamily protein [Dehalococcoidia bacterium]MYA54516.1 4'-phosphopantetheinyl transferase superfamily protein [Dehalococcoidia bacterium]
MPAQVSRPWWRPLRAEGATVLHVDLASDAARERAAFSLLNGEERERLEAFASAEPLRRFVLCRAALRAVLGEKLGCENEQLAFPTSEHGKPWATVDGVVAPIAFNVSHSGRHGLVAYAPEGRLGVDIEELRTRRRLDLLMDGALGPEERREVTARQGEEQIRFFFRLWTMKEAVLKAHGKGFLLDATSFEIPPAVRRGAAAGTLELPQEPGVTWQLEDLSSEHFVAALARGAG